MLVKCGQLVVRVWHGVVGDVHEAGVQLLAAADGFQHLGRVLRAVVHQTNAAGINGAHPGWNLD